MIVEFDNNLSVERISAEGHEVDMLFGSDCSDSEVLVSSFANPRLVTDTYRILQGDEPIRESLIALLGSQRRTARFGTTTHTVDKAKYPSVWAPSIDTFLMCSAIQQIDMTFVESVTEVGCGSGFVSKYMLDKLSPRATIQSVDNDILAIECAREAVNSPRAEFHALAGEDFLPGKRFDLVVSNPPYLPSPDGRDHSPFGGTTLMRYLLQNAAHFLTDEGRMILLLSSVGLATMESVMSKSRLKQNVLMTMMVPLKVVAVLNSPRWFSLLKSSPGIFGDLSPGYALWHELSVVEIRRS